MKAKESWVHEARDRARSDLAAVPDAFRSGVKQTLPPPKGPTPSRKGKTR